MYDVTYNTGINGYHQMDMWRGSEIPLSHNLLNLAKLADIKTSHAKAIVEQVVITARHLLAIINDYPILRR